MKTTIEKLQAVRGALENLREVIADCLKDEGDGSVRYILEYTEQQNKRRYEDVVNEIRVLSRIPEES